MSFFNNLSTLFSANKNGTKPTENKKELTSPKVIPIQPIKPKSQKTSTQHSPTSSTEDLADKSSSQAVTQTSVLSGQNQESVQLAQAKAREIVVEAKAEALSIRTKAEAEQRETMRKLSEQQRNLERKLDNLDLRLTQMDQKEQILDSEKQKLQKTRESLLDQEKELTRKLEQVARLTSDEARKQLLTQIDQTLAKEKAQLIRQNLEDVQANLDQKVKDILLDAMLHGATEYVPEYTVSVVTLPNEESKGKIIGKNGRNINAFERATGVDVDLDMSPTEVRLSCFDPVRREIARISLERLVKDGRIQPTRIEETVAKVKTEIDRVIFEAGKNLCHEVGVYNLPNDLMKMIGKFKYRFSYGQNLIAHTLEETKIGIKLASELGIDVQTVKLGCLLHDIGKVSEEEEGSHVELGVKIAKRFNMPQGVVDCIAQHHEDEPFSGPEQMVVYIADAISGARPGARYENYDEYVQRLTQLEEIATKFPQVASAYAIQAGREVRVLLDPEQSKDDDVMAISLQIRDEIQSTMTYPGTVTVTVLREKRAANVAK